MEIGKKNNQANKRGTSLMNDINQIFKGISIGGKWILQFLMAFWNATIHIVWGLATIFLLMGLVNFFQQDTQLVIDLIKISYFLMTNWFSFWIAFLTYELYIKFRLTRW